MMRPVQRFFMPLFLACLCSTACPASMWDDFLHCPGEEQLLALKNTISIAPQHCTQTSLPAGPQFAQLLRLMEDGDQSALRAGLLIYGCLDGGTLEDFYRSVGVFLELYPLAFLKAANDVPTSDRDLRYMVTMLPLTLVDNDAGRIAAINKRIVAIEAVSHPQAVTTKTKVLSFLETEKSDLEKVKARKPSTSTRQPNVSGSTGLYVSPR